MYVFVYMSGFVTGRFVYTFEDFANTNLHSYLHGGLHMFQEINWERYLQSCLYMFQDFAHMDMGRYLHGGVNITGFQLIDLESAVLKKFIKEWSNIDHRALPGARDSLSDTSLTVSVRNVLIFITSRYFGQYLA